MKRKTQPDERGKQKRKSNSSPSFEEIHARLERTLGTPHIDESRDALSVLVETILSQNTTDANSHAAFVSLRSRYPSWSAVAAAATADVEDCVRVAGLQHSKSRAIQNALQTLPRDATTGEPSLAHLAALSDDDAEASLLALPGVGAKTAACTLLFGLHRPRMPVDTHVFRVSSRLGLVSGTAAANRVNCQAQLEKSIPAQLKLPLHLLLIGHGRRTCKPTAPLCSSCVLSDICPRIGVRKLKKE